MSSVTIVFRDPAGAQSYIELPWQQGKRFRHYLRDPSLRRYHLVGRLQRSKAYGNDRRKLGYTSVLEPGETVHIVPASGAHN